MFSNTAKPTTKKPQPKSAAATTKPIVKGAGKPKRGQNAGRPKRKTAEELDTEMADYFVPKAEGGETSGAVVNGAAAAGGDATMDDQIM